MSRFFIVHCVYLGLHGLVDGYQRNLAQICTVWTPNKKVFKVRGQRSRSQQDQRHFCGGGLHFNGVALRLTC